MSNNKILTFTKLPAILAVSGVLGFAATNMVLAAATHTVNAKGKVFSAKKLEISAGDIVSYVNDDTIKHNILISKMKYDSGLQAPGDKSDVQFADAGKFKVRCAIHPKMKMVVVVK